MLEEALDLSIDRILNDDTRYAKLSNPILLYLRSAKYSNLNSLYLRSAKSSNLEGIRLLVHYGVYSCINFSTVQRNTGIFIQDNVYTA